MKKAGNGSIKNLQYLCLIGVIALGLLSIVGSNGTNGPNSKTDPNVTMGSITELSSIEVKLEWDEAYESEGMLDLLFNKAYAALPPEHQPHYKHSLIFDHNELTVTDTYKSFVGSDSSTMETSEVVRDNTVYNKFRGYLENTTYLCKVTRDTTGWAGPAHARITFTKADGTTQNAYFYGDNYSGQEDYELCSEEFSNYLSSLQTNRNTYTTYTIMIVNESSSEIAEINLRMVGVEDSVYIDSLASGESTGYFVFSLRDPQVGDTLPGCYGDYEGTYIQNGMIKDIGIILPEREIVLKVKDEGYSIE